MKTIDEMIAVMTAFKEGKQIEYKPSLGKIWVYCNSPRWDWTHDDYRIKPEEQKPTYRPFESPEEVFEAFKEHGEWIKHNGRYYKIIEITDKGISKGTDRGLWRYNELISCCTFVDGTPFGRRLEP